jgi:hypothetical protein
MASLPATSSLRSTGTGKEFTTVGKGQRWGSVCNGKPNYDKQHCQSNSDVSIDGNGTCTQILNMQLYETFPKRSSALCRCGERRKSSNNSRIERSIVDAYASHAAFAF